MPDRNEMTRLHVRVRGRVQGVGFRAHVEYAARALALVGWVRNVGYDQVEAVAEGAKSALQQLEQAMREGPRGSGVDEATVEWLDATGEFENFAVRRSV
jgi:acylphosphatase